MKANQFLRYARNFVSTFFCFFIFQTAYAEPVYPWIATAAGPLELGNAILLLMPDEKTEQISWDHQASGPIVWLTDGFKTEGEHSYRKGLLQINVLGKPSYVLLRKKNILAWTITYSTSSNPKFGVENISLSPGAGNHQPCFGTLFEGCSFELLPSLQKTGIEVHTTCEAQKYQERIAVYQASYPNKRTTNIVFMESGGSGGSSSNVTMTLTELNESVCKEFIKNLP
ncbi:hypothetical protein ACW4YW_09405 [Methylobacillus pratensis]